MAKLHEVYEAAKELIGKNVGRPSVYGETDKGKMRLAIAVAALTDKPVGRNVCLECGCTPGTTLGCACSGNLG
jgi:hypothetical protein